MDSNVFIKVVELSLPDFDDVERLCNYIKDGDILTLEVFATDYVMIRLRVYPTDGIVEVMCLSKAINIETYPLTFEGWHKAMVYVQQIYNHLMSTCALGVNDIKLQVEQMLNDFVKGEQQPIN